jgi:hypothetical protein
MANGDSQRGFRLYVDESGHHSFRALAGAEWRKKYLCLFGCIFENSHYASGFCEAVRQFRAKHFGEDPDARGSCRTGENHRAPRELDRLAPGRNLRRTLERLRREDPEDFALDLEKKRNQPSKDSFLRRAAITISRALHNAADKQIRSITFLDRERRAEVQLCVGENEAWYGVWRQNPADSIVLSARI